MQHKQLERAVKSSSIPPSVSWICEHFNHPFSLSFFLPENETHQPVLVLQLLKLTHIFPYITVRTLKFVENPRDVRILIHSTRGATEIGFGEMEKRDIDSYVSEIYKAGAPDAPIAELFSYAAFESRVLESLHIVSKYMLTSSDLDMLQHIFLTGLTAGYGLGFNRAVLFVYDTITASLYGEKAIGSLELEEARHIWEIIEFQDENIESFIKRYMEGDNYIDSSLLGATQDTCVKISKLPEDDEIRTVINNDGVSVFTGEVKNPVLKKLNPGKKYLLAPVCSHERLWGVVFMDNAFNDRDITPAITSMTELFINQTAFIWENYYMLQHFRKEARFDFLTGVANRGEMEKILDYLFSIEKPDLRFFLLLMDIDNFKQINDEKGHAFGDRILVEYSRILKSVIRGDDFVARYGGDEFLIIVRDVTSRKVREIAERLQTKIRTQLKETVSIGVACFPSNSKSRIELFQMADQALYAAKRSGKDRMIFFENGMENKDEGEKDNHENSIGGR